MSRAVALAALLLPGIAVAQPQPYVGPGPPPVVVRPDVFRLVDYGAVCDGVTDDDAAVNRAFAAMRTSTAYANNDAVTVVGPRGPAYSACVIHSINATGFTKGNGANLRPVVSFREATLLCTGAGNVCFDGLGSDLLKLSYIQIRGDTTPNSPEICIQIGMIGNVSAAWHSFDHVNCNNEFALTALYNFASESVDYKGILLGNNHTASGPIQTLGAITAGSSYTNGTYTAVALTGGSGTGALAKVVVAGTVVTSVTVTYQGRDYAAGDTLSADPATIGGSGSGFTVPVATALPYSAILDGQNYWRASSAFVTETLPTDTWQSLSLNTFYNASIRNGLWVGWTAGLRAINTYIHSGTGTACLYVFDNGVTFANIPPNWGLHLEFNCEGGGSLQSMVFLTGSNPTPVLRDFSFRGYHEAVTSTFRTDTNITAVTATQADIDMQFECCTAQAGLPMFSSAKLWTVSGLVSVPGGSYWNAPAAFRGRLVVGNLATPPNIGPVDILSGAAMAISCARQLSGIYTGALCQVQRTSDSLTLDLYPNVNGDLDRNAFVGFCNGTTCKVSIAYDQSGNTNNFVQATTASQPTLTFSLAALGGRPVMTFGDAGTTVLCAPTAASLNDIFTAGGYVAAVYNQVGNATAADTILVKGNAASTGFNWNVNTGGTSTRLKQYASTTPGSWSESAGHGLGSHVVDLQYSFASLANTPSISVEGGTPFSFSAPTQPAGTLVSDSASSMCVGGFPANSLSFPGSIGEIIVWKTTPLPAALEAIRRNEAVIYGVANVN